MKRVLRLFSPLIGLVMLFVGIAEAYPNWVTDMGMDFWNNSELDVQLHEQEIRDRQMTIQRERINRRVIYRESIIEDLLAERISLQSALVQFYEINRETPKILDFLEFNNPGKTPWEKTVSQLTGYLQPHFRQDPQKLDRWHGELRSIANQMQAQSP